MLVKHNTSGRLEWVEQIARVREIINVCFGMSQETDRAVQGMPDVRKFAGRVRLRVEGRAQWRAEYLRHSPPRSY
jgi:hypothetical protein